MKSSSFESSAPGTTPPARILKRMPSSARIACSITLCSCLSRCVGRDITSLLIQLWSNFSFRFILNIFHGRSAQLFFDHLRRNRQKIIRGDDADQPVIFYYWKAADFSPAHDRQRFERRRLRRDGHQVANHYFLDGNFLHTAAQQALRKQSQKVSVRDQPNQPALIIFYGHVADVSPL